MQTLRPKQWVKNIVLFAGLVFDGQLLQLQPFMRVLAAAVIFSLVSGLTYTINDILDVRSDSLHPTKRERPIASGRLSVPQAVVLVVVLAVIAFPAAFLLSVNFGLITVGYTLLMLAYSKWLKQLMIIDVMVIAMGFMLRVLGGITVIQVNYISPWLFALTSLLALFIGFGKRLSEIHQLREDAPGVRKVLKGYTEPLLNQYLVVILSSILITYTLYTFSAHPDGNTYTMMLTVPFVFYGIFRYMYILQSKDTGAAPEEVLFSDKPLILTILLWGLSVMTVLYLIY